jgi:hypothetical protein
MGACCYGLAESLVPRWGWFPGGASAGWVEGLATKRRYIRRIVTNPLSEPTRRGHAETSSRRSARPGGRAQLPQRLSGQREPAQLLELRVELKVDDRVLFVRLPFEPLDDPLRFL